MKLLALDTATEACSAAILRDGVVDERYEVIGRGHATRLLPMADELLTAAGIAVGNWMRSPSAAVPAGLPGFASRRASPRASPPASAGRCSRSAI